MKSLNKIILILFFCVYLKAFPNKKEVVHNTTSFSVKKNDSIYLKKIENINKIFQEKKFDLALKEAFKLLDSSYIANDDLLLRTNYLIGNIFYETLNFKDAIKYFRSNIEIIETKSKIKEISKIKINGNLVLAENYLKLGSSYHKLKERDSLDVYRDSTLYFYNKVIDFIGADKKILATKAIAYSNMSAFHINDSLYDLAKDFAHNSINIHKAQNDKLNQAAALGNLASIYLIENNFILAKKIYLEGLDLIENDKSPKAVRFKASLYANLSWSMYKLKDYKAYEFQDISYNIKDELRNTEIRRIVKKIDAEYDVKTVKKILLKEEENKRLKDQKTFWIFGVSSLLIMISLLYFLNLYKLKQKNLGLKLSQTQLLQNQNLEKLKSESQARILNATIDGKESERKEIAETLHDSVSALLSSANLHLMATKSQFKGIIPIEIDKTQHIIAEASQKIRELSHTLVSSVLLKFGLNFAVKDMASKYSNSVLYIETDITGLRRYHQNFEIKVYNIIQEFINNILKHSKANNAFVKMYEENNMVCFQISDDGIGFDKTIVTNKDGLGLNQIEARIQMMNGKFLIESTLGEGTTISVKLPVVEKNKIIHV